MLHLRRSSENLCKLFSQIFPLEWAQVKRQILKAGVDSVMSLKPRTVISAKFSKAMLSVLINDSPKALGLVLAEASRGFVIHEKLFVTLSRKCQYWLLSISTFAVLQYWISVWLWLFDNSVKREARWSTHDYWSLFTVGLAWSRIPADQVF